MNHSTTLRHSKSPVTFTGPDGRRYQLEAWNLFGQRWEPVEPDGANPAEPGEEHVVHDVLADTEATGRMLRGDEINVILPHSGSVAFRLSEAA